MVIKNPKGFLFKNIRYYTLNVDFFHESWNIIFFSSRTFLWLANIFPDGTCRYLPSYFGSTFKTTFIIIIPPPPRGYLFIYKSRRDNIRIWIVNIWKFVHFRCNRARIGRWEIKALWNELTSQQCRVDWTDKKMSDDLDYSV